MFIKGEKRISTPRKSTPSKAKAIREKCKDCIYDETNGGTWLQQVTLCDSQDCALWAVRPVSKGIPLGNG